MSRPMAPPLGICIPTCNRADYLKECLASLRRQDVPKGAMRIYVSDNASQDHTPEVVKQFADLDIHYHFQTENLGAAGNYRFLYENSPCKYMLILCDDDWLADGYLSRAYDFMEAHEDTVMYSASAAYHEADGGNLISVMQPMLFEANPAAFDTVVTWSMEEFFSMCAAQTPVFLGSCLMRTSAFHQARFGNDAYFYSQEKVLYSKMLPFGSVCFDSRVGIHVRWHPAHLTGSIDSSAREEEFKSSTRRVIELAFEQGIDIPAFWHRRMNGASPQERAFFLKKLSRGFNQEGLCGILSGDGTVSKDPSASIGARPGANRETAVDITRNCPVCETSDQNFKPYGLVPRPGALCPSCGSLERHRLLWLYLQRRTDFFSRPQRLLDIAPMAALSARFKSLPGIDYLSIDQKSPIAMRHMDITRLELPDGAFDCLLCYHVLEHVAEDRQAISELFRILQPGGWGIIQVPIDADSGSTLEDPAIRSAQDRLKYYGNEDHVRQYGRDFKDRLEEAGFWVLVDPFAKNLAQEDIDLYGITPEEDIYFCLKPPGLHGGTLPGEVV